MIHDVDESLRELVRREVLSGANVEISFDAPNKDWSARRNTPTINLYLYEIREDLERRNIQIEEIRDENGFVVERRPPPRRFKLSYLITAWTQRPEDEHRVLASMLECFLAFDALPQDVLQGSLADQPYPVRATIGLPLPPERSISDVWTALGGELKASLDLIVTAPFETGRRRQIGPPVMEEPRIRLVGPSAEQTARRAGRGGTAGSGSTAEDGDDAAAGDRGPKRRRGAGTEPEDGAGGAGPEGAGGRSGAGAASSVAGAGPGAGPGQGPGRGAGSGPGAAGGKAVPVDEVRGGRGDSGRVFRVRGLPRQ